MADLGAFTNRTAFRIDESLTIRCPRIFYETRNIGTFRTEPSRGYRLAFIDQITHQLEVWAIDLETGAISEKTTNAKPSVMAAASNVGTFSAEQYDVALGPSLSLSVEQRPPMWIIYYRPDGTLGVYTWDVYRDQVSPLWAPVAGPAFLPIPQVNSGTWNGADGYLYNGFFAGGSAGSGPNQREVVVNVGFFQNGAPINYKACNAYVFDPQANSWAALNAFPPPTWGIGKEQEAMPIIPANGDVQAPWKTQSPLGIVTGGYKPRLEDVGISTQSANSVGNAIQTINEDPTINSQLFVGGSIGAYSVTGSTPPTLKFATVEQGAANTVHVYKTQPHISLTAEQWSEETVVQPGLQLQHAHCVLTGDRAGMVGQESGRQWLYVSGVADGQAVIMRAKYNVLTSRWDSWDEVFNLYSIGQGSEELLFFFSFFVIPGDDHNLIVIEYQDINYALAGVEKGRVVYALFDSADIGPTTGGISGPGRPSLVLTSGSSGSASWVA